MKLEKKINFNLTDEEKDTLGKFYRMIKDFDCNLIPACRNCPFDTLCGFIHRCEDEDEFLGDISNSLIKLSTEE